METLEVREVEWPKLVERWKENIESIYYDVKGWLSNPSIRRTYTPFEGPK